MTTHSSITAWEITWTEEPGGVLGEPTLGFPRGSHGKESAYNVGDPGSMPESGRSPEGSHGNSLQYSYLENPTNRGAWQATVHGVIKSWTRLSD